MCTYCFTFLNGVSCRGERREFGGLGEGSIPIVVQQIMLVHFVFLFFLSDFVRGKLNKNSDDKKQSRRENYKDSKLVLPNVVHAHLRISINYVRQLHVGLCVWLTQPSRKCSRTNWKLHLRLTARLTAAPCSNVLYLMILHHGELWMVSVSTIETTMVPAVVPLLQSFGRQLPPPGWLTNQSSIF